MLSGKCLLLDDGMQRGGMLIRIIYALCLFGATFNHVRAIVSHGWLARSLPTLTAVYWDSLTFLDLLAAILLFVRPRAGIGLTGAIIVSDVLHNLWFVAAHPVRGSFFKDVTSSAFLISQIAFLLFVAVTAPSAWKRSWRTALRH